MSRRVKVNAAKIRELRKARGWSAEIFAEAAELSVRTIGSAEADESLGISPFSLACIAKALDVQPEQLASSDIPAPETGKRIRITIEVPTPYAEFDEVIDGEGLINAMRALLHLPLQTVEIVGINRGSTIVTLEMDEKDAMSLRNEVDFLAESLILSRSTSTPAFAAPETTHDKNILLFAKLVKAVTIEGVRYYLSG